MKHRQIFRLRILARVGLCPHKGFVRHRDIPVCVRIEAVREHFRRNLIYLTKKACIIVGVSAIAKKYLNEHAC